MEISQKKWNKLVRSTASQLYMQNLKFLYEGISFGKIQKKLMQGDMSNADFWSSYSRSFYKNARGAVIKNERVVELIEKQRPGAKHLLQNILWQVLENYLADLDTIYELMRQLPPEFQLRIFKREISSGLHIRKDWRDTRPLRRISFENSLDALACLLLVVREMELLQKWHWYIVAKWEAFDLFRRLVYFEPFSHIGDNLLELVSIAFFDRNNPLAESLLSQLEDFEHSYYRSPPQISSTIISRDFYSGILWNAQQLNLVGTSREEQLNFLFWTQVYGPQKVNEVVKGYDRSEQAKQLLQRVIDACNSSNTDRYLPLTYAFNRDFI